MNSPFEQVAPLSPFDPIQLGGIAAPNRILMAPLTRGRATREHVPTPLMAEYYAQRAGAGLIISEATGISRQGMGWAYAPGIWDAEQVKAWTEVTAAVHRAGGRMVSQLWHMGRLVHPDFLNGAAPVSSSATTAPGTAHTYAGAQPYVQARALEIGEIKSVVDDYEKAARNAKAAGFDGVQLHAANGYLIDQFLRDNSNLRVDEYGGSVANRIRLLIEVVQRLISVFGADRTGVRLSPNGEAQGVNDSDPKTLFVAAAQALDALGIAFLELREPRPGSNFLPPDHPPIAPEIRKVFSKPLILNSGYDLEEARSVLALRAADAVSFGRPFLANPDLPQRFVKSAPLNAADAKTFYTQGAQGYTDYPTAT